MLVFTITLSIIFIFNCEIILGQKICQDSSDCDSSRGLYCLRQQDKKVPKVCACPTNTTIYDENLQRCVGKILSPCIHHENETFCPQNAICTHQHPYADGQYFYLPRCFCAPGYVANANNTGCILAAKFGKPCNQVDKLCDVSSRLKCMDGKCSCEFGPEHQYYDKTSNKCISYVQANCSNYYSCVENAHCEGVTHVIRRQKENSATITAPGSKIGVCTCEYGFSPTKDRQCMAAYRQVCSMKQPCNPDDNLECQDGSCNCQHPLHQLYDFDLGKCKNLVDFTCSTSSDCVSNAVCTKDNKNKTQVCRCMPGYTKTSQRLCLKSYNETCTNSQCNFYKGLTCKTMTKSGSTNNNGQGKCLCVDDTLTYNKEHEACLSSGVGSPCGRIGQAGDYGKAPFYISCEPGLICENSPDNLDASYCVPQVGQGTLQSLN